MSNKKNLTWPSYADNILTKEMCGICFAPTTPVTAPENLHYHSQFELGLCLRGRGVFYIQNDVYPFGAGDISVIYPGESHIAQSAKDAMSDWIFITVEASKLFFSWQDGERLKELYIRERGQGRILNPTENLQVAPYIRRMIALHADDSIGVEAKIGHYAALLACILYESAAWKSNELTLPHPSDDLIVSDRGKGCYPAIQYIFSHYTEQISIEQLCACCNVSPVQLRRLFIAAVGMSPLGFLHKIRISHACVELSSTRHPILAISEQCGYTSLSSFNRQFQKIMQMSPSEYRTTHQLS